MDPITLSPYSFIDIDLFNILSGEVIVVSSSGSSDEEQRLLYCLNSAIEIMENLCCQPLLARDFSYDPVDEAYKSEYEKYCIFDGPIGSYLWLPVFPVNAISELMISDTVIAVATAFNDREGYHLYKDQGKIYYPYGFDHGYPRNVMLKYNAGVSSTSSDYNKLQVIQFHLAKHIWDMEPGDDQIISETIGNYRYVQASPEHLSKFFGLPPFVFTNLLKYKKEVFS